MLADDFSIHPLYATENYVTNSFFLTTCFVLFFFFLFFSVSLLFAITLRDSIAIILNAA